MAISLAFLASCTDSAPSDPETASAPPTGNSEEPWIDWGADQVEFFAPQAWDALWAIGPVDAATSGLIGIGVAEQASAEKYPDESPSGEHRNTFRHCYGSCLAYQIIGDDALIAMDIHEEYTIGPDGACDSAIDRFNNDAGVTYARSEPYGSCYDFCSEAIATGGLMLNPGNPESARDATVSARCR